MRNRVLLPCFLISLAPAVTAQCDSAGALPATPGPTTPGSTPASPSTPGPFGFGTGSPLTAGGAGGLEATGGTFGEDHWAIWWSLYRDRYLDLGPRLAATAPTTPARQYDLVQPNGELHAHRVTDEVLPALVTLLGTDPDPLVRRSALLAAGKAAGGLGDAERAAAAAAIRPHLAAKASTIRESALVALGLAGHEAQAPTLAAILRDQEAGRGALGGVESVDPRRRAFAAYGLGLLAAQSEREDVRVFAVHHLAEGLEADTSVERDLAVACAHALGLIHLGGSMDPREGDAQTGGSIRSRSDLLHALLDRAWEPLGHPAVRAAAVRSLGTQIQALPAAPRAAWKGRAVPALLELLDPRAKTVSGLAGAAILALGELGDGDDDALDRRLRDVLQAREEGMALASLARVVARPGESEPSAQGARSAERHLLGALGRGRSEERAWAALALGVLAKGLEESGGELSAEARSALRTAHASAGRNDLEAAYALALGLASDARGVPLLIDVLDHEDHFLAGRAAVSLGLSGDPRGLEPLREALADPETDPAVRVACAEGLALLGDAELEARLTELLEGAGPLGPRAAVAASLGRVTAGTPRATAALKPLLTAALRPTQGEAARSACLDGLGRAARGSALSWKSPLTLALCVQGAPPTLFDAAGASLLGLP